jgi:hypothetical protein
LVSYNWPTSRLVPPNLQDARPEFDIHLYGARVLDAVAATGGALPEEDGENAMTSAEEVVSFTKVVQGQQAHEISRLFAAMLQLVRRPALWHSFGVSSLVFKPTMLWLCAAVCLFKKSMSLVP